MLLRFETGLWAVRLAEGRFAREIVPVEAPVLGEDGEPTGETRVIDRDEGLRATSLESLSGLQPVPGQEIHTAGSSSQVARNSALRLPGPWLRSRKC